MPPDPPPSPTHPLPLTVSLTCFNSAATLPRLLESVAPLAAEIVAIDSGSTDSTKAILRAHHARIIDTQWRGFIVARQRSLDGATQKWTLCLDSDESLTPALARSIREAISHPDAAPSGFTINRKVFYRGRPLNHAWQPERRLRLVRTGAAIAAGAEPHEHVALADPAAQTTHLRGDLRHDSFDSFADYFEKLARYARTAAATAHASGKRSSRLKLIASPAGAFLKQLIVKQAFLDGAPGFLAASATAAGAFMKHADLLEMGSGEGE